MKIGIDASRLSHSNRTGTGNYLYYLIKSLSNFDKTNKYVLYFRNEPDPSFILELTGGNRNFSPKTLTTLGSWTQISLALEMFKNTPDVLLCSWHTMPAINPFWKMKTIATIHDTTGKFIPTYWTIKFASHLIAVSQSTKDSLIKKYGGKSESVSVVYEGVNLKDFSRRDMGEINMAKEKYGIDGEYIFFLGSLGPRKNIENMIKAFNSLNSDVEFVLGGVPLAGHEDLSKLPANFIGEVDQEDLAALYSGARFFAFVSKEEGFGVPILESMACETPVLTSDTSAMKEIALDAALLVEPTSIESIASGMKRLLEDEILGSKLIMEGNERHRLFSWEKAAEETLKIIERVASGQ